MMVHAMTIKTISSRRAATAWEYYHCCCSWSQLDGKFSKLFVFMLTRKVNRKNTARERI